jgi:hypothetical protein
LISIKVAVNHFHHFLSFDRKESAQFVSHSLQICTRGWHLTNVDYFTRLNVNHFTRSGFENEIQIILIVSHKKIHLIFLPFNLVVKSATTDLVLFNSVLVEAKVVFAVFKSFEIAVPFNQLKFNQFHIF